MDNMEKFHKRHFRTLGEMFKEFRKTSAARKRAKQIADKDKIPSQFAEKIMLAVTGVNDCISCSYRHTKAAIENGVGVEEALSILRGEFGDFPEEESVGLLYAQHWADNAGNPDDLARQKTIAFYGKAKTDHIELYMQMVTTGNLISNTVEAYEKKLRPQNGRFGFFLMYLLCKPIALLIKSNTKSVERHLKERFD